MKFPEPQTITIYALGFYTILLVWLSTDLITCKKDFLFYFQRSVWQTGFIVRWWIPDLCYMCEEGLVLCGTCLYAFNHIYGSNGNWQRWSGLQITATSIADVLYHCVGLNSRKWVCNHFLRWTQEAFVNRWQEDFDENRGVIRQETPESWETDWTHSPWPKMRCNLSHEGRQVYNVDMQE